jgi:hypothetical protein
MSKISSKSFPIVADRTESAATTAAHHTNAQSPTVLKVTLAGYDGGLHFSLYATR